MCQKRTETDTAGRGGVLSYVFFCNMRLKTSKRNAYFFLKNTLVPASEQTDGPYGGRPFICVTGGKAEKRLFRKKTFPRKAVDPVSSRKGINPSNRKRTAVLCAELVNCDNNLTF